MNKYLLLFAALFSWACSSEEQSCEDAPDVSAIQVEVPVQRLENELFEAESKKEVARFLEKRESFAHLILRKDRFPNDSILINNLYKLAQDPYLDTLYQEVQQIFGDFSQTQQQFEQAFAYGKHYFPNFRVPEVRTMMTGLSPGHDMYVSDSLVFVGLDYFAGPEASYRPQYPQYILNRFTPEHIVPNVLLIYSEEYNKTDYQDESLLAEMVFYGKAYYFTKQLLPCTPDSLIIGYSAEEMKGVKANEEGIWAHFLQNELLYSSNHFEKSKYISERPKVSEVGDKCPGRIGIWLGWQIVERYMQRNPNVTLKELMNETDARKIFNKSKYRP